MHILTMLVAATLAQGASQAPESGVLPNGFFIKNEGQWPSDARYLARYPGLDVWVTDDGLRLDAYREIDVSDESDPVYRANPTKAKTYQRERVVVFKTLQGARTPSFQLEEPTKHRISYALIEQDKDNRPSVRNLNGVATGHQLRMADVYPGVDMVLYSDKGRPRYDFEVKPGADPSQIALKLDGGNSTALVGDRLVVRTEYGNIEHRELKTYQEDARGSSPVNARFALRGDMLKFELGAYDRTKTLVIDPVIVSTVVGGSGFDEALCVDHGHAGEGDFNLGIKVANFGGRTPSPDFPVGVGQSNARSEGDGFIATHYLGLGYFDVHIFQTVYDDRVTAIAGATNSPNVAWVNVASPTPFAYLVQAPYYGSVTLLEQLDAPGGVYMWDIDVRTPSPNLLSSVGMVQGPVTGPSGGAEPLNSPFGGWDGFVHMFSATVKLQLYVGGSETDGLTAVDVDFLDNIFAPEPERTIGFAGYTESPDLSFARNSSYAGGGDAIVGMALYDWAIVNTHYVGGSGYETASGASWFGLESFTFPIVNLAIVGHTRSQNFPLSTPVQSTPPTPGERTGFYAVHRVVQETIANDMLLQRTRSGYFGGVNSATTLTDCEYINNTALAVVGHTIGTDMTTTQNAFQASPSGNSSGLVALLDVGQGEVMLSSFWGGSAYDAFNAMSPMRSTYPIPGQGFWNATTTFYAVGATTSADFPIVNSDQYYEASGDATLAAFDLRTAQKVRLAKNTLTGVDQTTGTVFLTLPNYVEDTTVQLMSTSSRVQVPTSVVVRKGQRTAAFPVATLDVLSSQTAQIVAHALDATVSTEVTVGAPPLIGRLVFNGASGANVPTQATLQFREHLRPEVLIEKVVALDANGNFATEAPSGRAFDVSVKESVYLRRTLSLDSRTDPLDNVQFGMIPGDCNGDNSVNLFDFLVLRQAFGSAPGSPNWNDRADLNRDGSVNLVDFVMLRSNYGRSGDL